MTFDSAGRAAFAAHYPHAPARLSHELSGCRLFNLETLARMAARWPAAGLEYNAGNLPVGHDPSTTPRNGLCPDETVRRICECDSWLVLKNVERDPAFAALLDACLADLAGTVRRLTGPMHKREAFVFVSSPGAVTPFHMDPEHNILLQIRGSKTMRLYPARDETIVPQTQHERFHGKDGHRNLAYRDAFEERAQAYALAPGDALYVPVKAPHWVKNGADVSISFSITWRSRLSDNEARLHRANAWLRARGAKPPAPGEAPLRDGAKTLLHRAASRLSF